jgi:glutaminyl-peptide cyclotransferase
MARTCSFLRGAWLAALTLSATSVASVCAKPTTQVKAPPVLRLKVVRSYPHDPQAFTQGLLLVDGKLYESTGLLGRSSVRRVDLASGQPDLSIRLPPELFGEGLARVGPRLFQLTWKNHKALVWDLASLKQLAEIDYEGEGWGLCFDGTHLIMSDGSDQLARRNPTTFAKEGELRVRLAGRPLVNLNELECAGDVIYANVWQDSHIARIDGKSGEVTGWIDASGLLDRAEAGSADVLNGIAALSGDNRLLVTGKLWPRLFEVEVVTAMASEGR